MTDHHSEELLGLLDRIREFLRTQVYPLEAEFLGRPFRELTPALNAKREQVKAMGLWAPHLPKEHGGLGLTLSELRSSVKSWAGRRFNGSAWMNLGSPQLHTCHRKSV
jgi:acyl-CoA dehydrogenase